MDAFLFAVDAVLPLILMVALGYLAKRAGLIPEEITKHLNRLVFRILLPCNLFLNVYGIEDIGSVRLGYVWYVIGGTLVILLLALPAVAVVTRDGGQRGTLVQAIFRSNYALIGIPVATALAGQEGAVAASLLSAFIIPCFNVLAVICLTIYGDGGRADIKKILVGILKNPLIGSIAAACACLGVRALLAHLGISFRLSDITPVYSVLGQLSKTATPIALLTLGAQFSFSAIPELKRQILFGTLLRTVAVPAVGLGVACLLGCFTQGEMGALVAVFATPVAVSTVPMAQEMGADTRLAGQLVVFSTLASGATIFLCSFLLRAVGVFS